MNDLDELEQRDNPRRKGAAGWLGMGRRAFPAAIGGAVLLFIVAVFVLAGGWGDGQRAGKDREGVVNLEARLNKLEFQHRMVLENVNKMQESSGAEQNELAKLRKAVSDLEERIAGLENRLADRAGSGRKPTTDGDSRDRVQRHTVEKGDTLFRIGQRYGVSVEQLRQWNDLGENEYIQPGQELKVSE